MIRYGEPTVEEATCDACGASILTVEETREDGKMSNPAVRATYVNRATLTNDFGWPDDTFDVLGNRRPSFDLCRECTKKVLAVLGISHDRFCGEENKGDGL